MKVTRHEVLINSGSVPQLSSIISEVEAAIKTVVWPLKSDKFTINPTPKGNGVKPIKNECMDTLNQRGGN